MSDEIRPPNGGSSVKSFIEHLFVMPRHHKALLTMAMFLFGGGLAGQAMEYFSPSAPQTVQASTDGSAPDAKYMVSDAASQPSAQSDADRPLFRRISPSMMRVGFTFIAGFVIGWAFRAFLKMMAMLTALGTSILVALSYFHVLNIDFSAVEKKYQSDMAWISDQADRGRKALQDHLPASASSFLGMFLGFKRK